VYALGGRDSYLGIRSSWGQIQAGGFGTAWKAVNAAYNANPSFNHGGLIMANGDSTGASPSPNCAVPGLTAAATAPAAGVSAAPNAGAQCGNQAEGGTLAFSRRESNYIEYTTPNLSGFVGKIGTIASEFAEPSTTTTVVAAGNSQSKPKLWSYSLAWAGGPWSAAVAYEYHSGYRATNVAGSNRNARDKAWSVGGKWNFGQGQIGAGWESMDYSNAGTGVAGGNNAFKQKFWVINGSFNVTPAGTISAGYSKTPGRKSCGDALTALVGGLNTAAGGGCGDMSGAKLWTLGYDHALSKRTKLYAQYHKLDNNGNANGGAGYYYIAGPTGNAANGVSTGGPAIGANGIDVTTIAVGVSHSF
jgi:predicted porin